MKTKTLVNVVLIALVVLAVVMMIVSRRDPTIRVQAPMEVTPPGQPPTQLYPPVDQVNDPNVAQPRTPEGAEGAP